MCISHRPNLLPSPGFEATEGWEVLVRDGAEGQCARDEAKARSGGAAMRFTKKNGRGYLSLTTAAPVHVKPGVKYTFRGWFHSEDAPVSALLLFRMGEKDGDLYYDAIDRSAGWMSQSLLINSPAGQWEKRVITYQAAKEQDVYPHVVLYGNPCSVWVDDLEFTAEPYRPKGGTGQIPTPFSREEVLQVLAGRPNATAQAASRDGRSVLLLNGRPVPPVLYKGEPYHTSGDYAGFGKAGVEIATVSVRLGSVNNMHGFWTGKAQYDFSAVEEPILAALRKNPKTNLVLDVWFYPYREWGDENPEECWTNEKGQRAYGWWGNVEGFTDDLKKVDTTQKRHWWYPSYQSEKWRQDSVAAANEMIRQLRATPYWKAVVGFFLCGGHDGQFQVLGGHDFSAATRRRFQEWCRSRYGTPEALAHAWNQPAQGFDAVAVPPTKEAGGMESHPPYLAPGAGVDYREFAETAAWEVRDLFAGAVKAAAGKPVFTIAYGNPPEYYFNRFLPLKHLDAAGSMSYYPYRNPGYDGAYKPENAYALHGKLFFQELYIRSWTSDAHDEVYSTWIGAGRTPETWKALQRKLVGVSLANDQGFWYYDMNRYFDDPAILEQIAATVRVTRRLQEPRARRFRPDVCLVRAGDGARYYGAYFNPVKSAEFYQRMELNTSGVPHDIHYLSDILARPELQNYKVYVFLHTAFLSAAERAGIEQRLKRAGKTLVWVCDSGYVTEKGASTEALSKLVGMNVATKEGYDRRTPQVLAGAHSLVKDVAPFQGMSEMFLWVMHKAGPSSFGSRYQPFWVEDAGATPLAKYAEDGRVAAAVKAQKGWTSVYLAAPNGLAGDLLNNIARAAGAYVCGRPGQSIQMNGAFLSLHGMRTGDYTFHLPAGVRRVLDADTGKVVAQGVKQSTLPVKAQETYWYLME